MVCVKSGAAQARRILLLSAYRADSHAVWADWLVGSFPQHDWFRLELPGRHFSWRIRGNPLSWIEAIPDRRFDLVVATSMVDLATLRGLQPALARVPALLYFHENQFAYPASDRQFRSVDPLMVQLYAALSAQRVLFNSAWNRDSFLDGVDALLAKMPDQVPDGIRERLAGRSAVCPVPIEPIAPAVERDPALIVWNHRWEYDKAPELFAEAMIALARRGHRFRLALLGARPEKAPPALAALRRELGDRIVADGRLGRADYRGLLVRAGVVVSTARHEFQGLAVLEAVSAGARPLVPDALCYREQYPKACRYPAGRADALLERLGEWLVQGLPASLDVSPWTAEALQDRWQGEMESVIRTARN